MSRRIAQSVDDEVIKANVKRGKGGIYLFSKRLNELLEEKGIHQIKIAKDLGIAASTVSNYRNGLNAPNSKDLIEIAKYLGVSSDYLLGIKGDDPKALLSFIDNSGFSASAATKLYAIARPHSKNEEAQKIAFEKLVCSPSFEIICRLLVSAMLAVCETKKTAFDVKTMADSDEELRERTEGALRVVDSGWFLKMLIYSVGSTLSEGFQKILDNRKGWEADIRAIYKSNEEG